MKTYIVQRGDSLWLISQRYGITLDSLIAANPQITNPDVIDVGMVVNIPVGDGNKPPNQECPVFYLVQSGDTMWQIAQKNGVTLAALINANPQIANPNQIDVGQQICIPNANIPFANMPIHKSKKGPKTTVLPTLPPVTTMAPLPPIPSILPVPTEEYCPPSTMLPHPPTLAPIPTLCPIPPMHPPVYHIPMHPMPTVCPTPPRPPIYPMPQIPREITVHHMHHICGCCSTFNPWMY